MKISGSFPTRVGKTSATQKVGYRYVGNDADYFYMSRDEAYSLILPELERALARDGSKYITGLRSDTHFGPWYCKFSGDALPGIPISYAELQPVKFNNGSRWRAAPRKLDIVMSDYFTGMLEITYQRGLDVESEGGEQYFDLNCVDTGLWPTQHGTNIIVNGRSFNMSFRLYFRVRTLTEGKSPLELGFNEAQCIKKFRDMMLASEVDDSLVTSCLADANSGTIDALTALAEAPETLKSMLDGVKAGLSMYKEARGKAFRLYNKAKGKSNRATASKNARELADALADVWMNFRYNIQPNIYMVEDIQRTLLANLNDFLRFRDTNRSTLIPPNVGSWSSNSELGVVKRVLIKRLIDAGVDFAKFKHLVLTNTFVTGWELLPLSFVADWFLNIGDCIAATTIRPDIRLEAATFSWKVDGTAVYQLSDNPLGPKVTITCKSYRRDVISPSAHTSLTFDPEINLFRQLDAIALGWGGIKRAFSKN